MDLFRARNIFRDERNQKIGPPDSENQSAEAADGGEEDAFREQLPNDPAAARAESGAERDLLLPDGGAGEKEVGDIRARDQEHAADRAEENVKPARDIADQILAQRRGAGTEFGVRIRILSCECGGDRAQLGVGLPDRDTWFQTTDALQAVIAALFRLRFVPSALLASSAMVTKISAGSASIGKTKSAGMIADDGERPAIERDRLSEDGPVAFEMLLPKGVTENDRETTGAAARLFFVAPESAAENRMNAQDIKKFARDFFGAQTLRRRPRRRGRDFPVDKPRGRRSFCSAPGSRKNPDN